MFMGSGIRMGTSLGAHYEHQGGEWRWRQRQSQALGLGPPSVRKLGSWGAAGSEGAGRVYRVLGATWRRAAGRSLRAAVSVLAGGGTAAVNIEMTTCFTFSLCRVREVWVGSPSRHFSVQTSHVSGVHLPRRARGSCVGKCGPR